MCIQAACSDFAAELKKLCTCVNTLDSDVTAVTPDHFSLSVDFAYVNSRRWSSLKLYEVTHQLSNWLSDFVRHVDESFPRLRVGN